MEKASKELIERLIDGDHDAFATIYSSYVDKLYYFSLKLVKSTELAEELVQEVFIKIWKLRKTLNTELSFDAFLFRIVRNMAINNLKKVAYQNRVKEEIRIGRSATIYTTEAMVAYNETLAILENVLEKLPPKRQRIYRLSRIEGLDHDTIAKTLKISKNTVKVQMVKASKFVRERMIHMTELGVA